MSGGIAEAVAELPYTYRYFRELSPTFLSLALLNQGVAFDVSRPLRYLELGFGQGVSLNIHAAACEGEFWGNDYNPAHLAHAQSLSAASGADVRLLLDTFVDLAARDDLPEFDVIALHGVWSWVSEDDRTAIVELARRRLAPGGVLYVSYNCSTGWAAALGLRELLTAHATHEARQDAPITARVEDALVFAQELAQAGARYFTAHPDVAALLQSVAGKDRAYASHEMFGVNLAPRSFGEVSAQLGEIGLQFAGSAMLLMHDHDARLPQEGSAMLSMLKSPVMREMTRDAFANMQFREDIFVKGEPNQLSVEERVARLRDWRFALTTPFGALPPSIRWLGTDINLATEVNALIVKALRADQYSPKTLSSLETAIGRSAEHFLGDLITLVGAGPVQPVQRRWGESAQSRCAKLNAHICARAEREGKVGVLASPVLGAGVHVGRLGQLILQAIAKGRQTAADQAAFVRQCLDESEEAAPLREAPNVAELTRLAQEFSGGMLPILRATGIA
jgi:SAM-dependent methyltransferase